MLKGSLLATTGRATSIILLGMGLAAFPLRSALADTQQPSGDTGGNSELEPIVVTSQRRSENLQSTPLAVTALTGNSLTGMGISTLEASAAEVPNLNIGEQIGQTRITLRGVGTDNVGSPGAETNIAFNQDNVYYSRSSAALASFYDVDRVEVLRGPQGTLYGRNATGGSVNIITKQPTDTLEGYQELTIGNYGTINTEGAVGGPLADGVSGRLAYQTQHHDGYGINEVTGHEIDNKDSQAARGAIKLVARSDLSLLIGADYYQSKDASNGYHNLGSGGEIAPGVPLTPVGLTLPGGFVPANVRDIASAVDPDAQAKFYGARIDINWNINDIWSMRSLSAVRRSEYDLLTNLSPTGPTLLTETFLTENSTEFMEDLTLNATSTNNKFVGGVFFMGEKVYGLLNTPLNTLLVGGPDFLAQGADLDGTEWTRAAALYGQDTYSFTSSLRFTLGGRYSWERKAVNEQTEFNLSTPFGPDNRNTAPPFVDRQIFQSFDPKVGIEYDLARDALLYASYSTAFKSGIYNLGQSTPALKPEKIKAYEIGLKSELFDHHLRANLAAFYYDYTDLQVPEVAETVLVLENAAAARIYGIEGEFEFRPLDSGFLVSLSAGYLNARFTDFFAEDSSRPGQGNAIDPTTGQPWFNLAGNEMAQAPNYTINLAPQYSFNTSAGSITIRGESVWTGRVYFNPFDRDLVSQAPVDVFNASVKFESSGGHFYVAGYLRNIANKTVAGTGENSNNLVGGSILVFLDPPRTGGVTFGYRL